MPMRLTKYEQETIILFNESESTAAVYTYNTRLQNTLNSLCQSHPEQATQTGDNGYGGLTSMMQRLTFRKRNCFLKCGKARCVSF